MTRRSPMWSAATCGPSGRDTRSTRRGSSNRGGQCTVSGGDSGLWVRIPILRVSCQDWNPDPQTPPASFARGGRPPQDPFRDHLQNGGRHRLLDGAVLAQCPGLTRLEEVIQPWKLLDGVIAV